jgi:hypothetical protein
MPMIGWPRADWRKIAITLKTPPVRVNECNGLISTVIVPDILRDERKAARPMARLDLSMRLHF